MVGRGSGLRQRTPAWAAPSAERRKEGFRRVFGHPPVGRRARRLGGARALLAVGARAGNRGGRGRHGLQVAARYGRVIPPGPLHRPAVPARALTCGGPRISVSHV